MSTPKQLFGSQFFGDLLENLFCMECCKQAGWALAALAGQKLRHSIAIYTGREVLPYTQGDRRMYAVPLGMLV